MAPTTSMPILQMAMKWLWDVSISMVGEGSQHEFLTCMTPFFHMVQCLLSYSNFS